MQLTETQSQVKNSTINSKIFLAGPAGCGKTTSATCRLQELLVHDQPADSVLVLTPQRTLQTPYETVIRNPDFAIGSQVSLATMGGLARRMVDLFWPLVAEPAGFAEIGKPPVFLTLETAQYYMAYQVRPLLEEGFFSSVTIDRNRLYSQILDNLNKAASVGFPHTEISQRLSTAWVGDPGQHRVYADVQECANRFREFCLKHNLLDFSLQLDIFWNLLWKVPGCRGYLNRQYRHLIYDNIEEDFPVAHDLLLDWLPDLDSALIIFDEDGGYRRFLGADPESASRLAACCDTRVELRDSFVASPDIKALESAFRSKLLPGNSYPITPGCLSALSFASNEDPTHFYPQMLDAIARQIHTLVNKEQLDPSEIVVLVPYLSDALRFSLGQRLEELGIPWRTHRPSRSLRSEPACQCLLTLAELAHPGWEMQPARVDVSYAMQYAIDGLDLVRATLLASIVYRTKDFSLSSFSSIRTEIQERLTYTYGQHYQLLRDWLEDYRTRQLDSLDHFFRRLFGEVLSLKGYGFSHNPDGVRAAASLVESVRKFRIAMQSGLGDTGHLEVGKEYMHMLRDGVLAAQYTGAWSNDQGNSVLIAPAYTFLMMNQPVTIQFWLDVGSAGWWERLFQPLTQPYVLSRSWQPDALWTDAEDQAANRKNLADLITGLMRRCRGRIFLGLCDLGETGFEQRGPLLKAVWKMQMENGAVNA